MYDANTLGEEVIRKALEERAYGLSKSELEEWVEQYLENDPRVVRVQDVESLVKMIFVADWIAADEMIRILSRLGIVCRGLYVYMIVEKALACFEGYPFTEEIVKEAIKERVYRLSETDQGAWLQHFLTTRPTSE
jgi:hypothetical protein